jgi:hypothetical protein
MGTNSQTFLGGEPFSIVAPSMQITVDRCDLVDAIAAPETVLGVNLQGNHWTVTLSPKGARLLPEFFRGALRSSIDAAVVPEARRGKGARDHKTLPPKPTGGRGSKG